MMMVAGNCLASVRNTETGDIEACMKPLLGDTQLTDEGDFFKASFTCAAGHSSVVYQRKIDRRNLVRH